jgi:hypothetical protein
MFKPINLRTKFGDKYIIRFEESREGSERDPWLYIIPARSGHFYPFSSTEVAASVDGHPKLARKLARLPFVRVHQDGDDGATLVFDQSYFAVVARVLKPIKRRTRRKSAA